MSQQTSLYESSRFIPVGRGGQHVQVCVAELQRAGSADQQHAPVRRVLLIHGNPSHLDHWLHTVANLQQYAAVAAYDQPGLGRSGDFPDARQALERSADVALDVLDQLGWSEPVDLIGQSHGGMIALALAARSPARVRSVVLLGTGGTPAHAMYRFFMVPGLDSLLLYLGHAFSPRRDRSLAATTDGPRSGRLDALLEKALAWIVRLGARSSFAPDPVPELVVEQGLHAPPTVLQTMVRLAHDGPCRKVAAYAPCVRCPVLFVHARNDALVHISYARRLYELMKRAGCPVRFVELSGGHMVHFTRPELVAPVLNDALFGEPAAL